MSSPMYIVTGATGHIGNNIVRYLLSKGLKVKVLIRKMDVSLDGLDLDIAISQTFDHAFLDREIKESDMIIHCAAYIDLMNKSLVTSYRTNVQLTKRIVDIAIEKKNRFVYLSSVDVIPKTKRGLIKEPLSLDIKKSKSYYKTTKSIATSYVYQALHRGLNGIILYPAAVVGIHDYKPSAAGREILNVMRHKIVFSIHGGYNFIDVMDVAKACYQATLKPINDHIILSGHEITIKKLYTSIEEITQTKKIIIPLPLFIVRLVILFSRTYSQMMISTIQENYHYDNQEMKDVLGITPTPLKQTLTNTISWLDINYKR
ncbi:MAG TPA: hypothetical protein DEA30_03385 [Acholeplasmataceae bacterium]|nr:hypothetical protein [Acholeplasmataceae bacterium]HBO66685.1 hypothetical protein [Acholeplasmataceae bacterium]HBS00909.1 hypothetical protein [Acholeplasmataceae bacterium]